MLKEEIELVKRLAREIAKEEIAKALAEFAPPAAPAGLKVETAVKPTKKVAKSETF